jgi:hypothetical protein
VVDGIAMQLTDDQNVAGAKVRSQRIEVGRLQSVAADEPIARKLSGANHTAITDVR